MYFQNPFGQEFREKWPKGQDTTIFIGANRGNIGDAVLAGNPDPYDLSVVNLLHINFAYDPSFKNYSTVSINIAGTTPAQTTAFEIVNILNSNVTFSTYFTAFTQPINGFYQVGFRKKNPRQTIRFYLSNQDAETILKFNAQAPVKELPSYFVRHTVENRFNYPDSQAVLIELDPGDPVDAALITEAGLSLTPQEDWQLLHGRSNNYLFQKYTVDGSDRVTEIIQYPAGAVEGDLATKFQFQYTGANTTPDQSTMVPYTLQSGDLITP